MFGEGALISPADVRWREALALVRHDVFHLPAYATLEAEPMSGDAQAFLYCEAGNVLLLPLVVRDVPGTGYRDACSPYGYPGPVANCQDETFWAHAAEALADTLRSAKIVTCFVRIHPLLPPPTQALSKVGEVRHHGETVAIDLQPPDEEWLAQISHGHRRGFRKFASEGNQVLFDAWDTWDAWIDAYHENMRRVGAASHYFFPPEYLSRLRALLGPHVNLVAAFTADGDFMGGCLLLEYDGMVQQFLLGIREQYLRAHTARALFVETRRWGHARGDRVQHLGGGRGGANDSLFEFKLQFSKSTRSYFTWRVVADTSAYDELLGAPVSGLGARSDTGLDFFPAYRGPESSQQSDNVMS